MENRESGLSARTIARRLSSVSGFYAYLVARGDTGVAVNPVPRGLSARRAGGRSRTVRLVRVPHTLPKILDPDEVRRLLGALRTDRDRAVVLAMLLGGLRRCEVLGLRRLPRYRLVVEVLARTGRRASELCELGADAVTRIGDAHWLRVPVGKLRNDRFIPLHPDLVALLAEWTAVDAEHIRRQCGVGDPRLLGQFTENSGLGAFDDANPSSGDLSPRFRDPDVVEDEQPSRQFRDVRDRPLVARGRPSEHAPDSARSMEGFEDEVRLRQPSGVP